MAQFRAQLVNALEDSAQFEREYNRIKHEGSLLCNKYDDVCKKLREASTEYNNLCDIYDSQVRDALVLPLLTHTNPFLTKLAIFDRPRKIEP